MNIDIELTEYDIEYLKWFKEQHRPEMGCYHPIMWHLEYMGVLLTTNIDYENDGKECDRTFILPTGIGKEILKSI